MVKCCFCENYIKQGLVVGFWGPDNKTKPICIKCLKNFLESEGSETGLKARIKKWLEAEKISFNSIHEPSHLFHYTLKNVGPLKMSIESFQEKNKDELIVGFMTFLSKELNFKIYRFSLVEKEEFKKKVDELLSSIRVDYRSGMRVGYQIISDKGHYGVKYFVKSKVHELDKENFFNILAMAKETGVKIEIFLSKMLKN